MDTIFEQDSILGQVFAQCKAAYEIWMSGGWAMIAIAVIALVMFAMGMHVHLQLSGKGHQRLREKTWRSWIDKPEERKGPVGTLLDFVTQGKSIGETGALFEQASATETVPIERDLKVMKICVSAAPLVGLLGTVTGMLATFGALASGSGGEKTMGMVAKGISEALITTETGLVIALPGLFFQYMLVRRFERYKAFLTQLQTVCTQTRFRGVQYAIKTTVPEKTETEHRDRDDREQGLEAVSFRGGERMASAAS